MTATQNVETEQAAREAIRRAPVRALPRGVRGWRDLQARPAKTVTESDDHLFCLLTMNHHPLHINDVYARVAPSRDATSSSARSSIRWRSA